MTEPSPGPAAETYRDQVADIMDSRAADVPYPPGAPELTVVNRRLATSTADLNEAEIVQLRACCADGTLEDTLADPELQVEAAEVVDGSGAVRYRLYGWNYGCGWLFPPDGLDVVAFAAQHDLEHWSLAQRDLFAGMDRALRAGGHGFRQPLFFCWADDSCWEKIADAAPHSVQSEPYLRRLFGLAGA